MKYKCPKREVRESSWTRIPAPYVNDFDRLKRFCKSHVSTGHFWYNPINTHWWIEKPDDAAWVGIGINYRRQYENTF